MGQNDHECAADHTDRRGGYGLVQAKRQGYSPLAGTPEETQQDTNHQQRQAPAVTTVGSAVNNHHRSHGYAVASSQLKQR